eukprot:CAMPEP_0181340872 /NCGR_PEP_ID=MMETSP1101-20121128/30086_1 /TAXON_ID=46948 /ORGANISM="Rhodomonas abbreviata, Strain Caron Lab Isolate" /LENGTH=792 /DNA_ID=CAMNT_0023452067 /DNA_START=209 /DNA_END=2587 /DNA_ORIENTATION=+
MLTHRRQLNFPRNEFMARNKHNLNVRETGSSTLFFAIALLINVATCTTPCSEGRGWVPTLPQLHGKHMQDERDVVRSMRDCITKVLYSGGGGALGGGAPSTRKEGSLAKTENQSRPRVRPSLPHADQILPAAGHIDRKIDGKISMGTAEHAKGQSGTGEPRRAGHNGALCSDVQTTGLPSQSEHISSGMGSQESLAPDPSLRSRSRHQAMGLPEEAAKEGASRDTVDAQTPCIESSVMDPAPATYSDVGAAFVMPFQAGSGFLVPPGSDQGHTTDPIASRAPAAAQSAGRVDASGRPKVWISGRSSVPRGNTHTHLQDLDQGQDQGRDNAALAAPAAPAAPAPCKVHTAVSSGRGLGAGIKRSVSYEKITPAGELSMPTIPVLPKTGGMMDRQQLVSGAEQGRGEGGEVEETAEKPKRKMWLPWQRQPEEEVGVAGQLGSAGEVEAEEGDHKEAEEEKKPKMWLPWQRKQEEGAVEEQEQEKPKKKERSMPWLPFSRRQPDDAEEDAGATATAATPKAARPTPWLPPVAGAGAGPKTAPPKAPPGLWLPSQPPSTVPQSTPGAAADAQGARKGRPTPWIPPHRPAGTGADGWPTAGGSGRHGGVGKDGWPVETQNGGWKPKYDMTLDDGPEEVGGKDTGWKPKYDMQDKFEKPKYDMRKGLDASEAVEISDCSLGEEERVGRRSPVLKTAEGRKTQRSGSPTLKLKEKKKELDERAAEPRLRTCDRCKMLCQGAWLMGYDMVHCSDACLKATEEAVHGDWQEGWDSVEAFLRPRGGPRRFPNAMTPSVFPVK